MPNISYSNISVNPLQNHGFWGVNIIWGKGVQLISGDGGMRGWYGVAGFNLSQKNDDQGDEFHLHNCHLQGLQEKDFTYHLVMTFTVRRGFSMALIEIDGLHLSIAWWIFPWLIMFNKPWEMPWRFEWPSRWDGWLASFTSSPSPLD